MSRFSSKVVRSARFAERRRSVRAEQARRRRRAALALALVGGLSYGGWAISRSSLSEVTRIEVVGAHLLDPDDVIAASGVRVGDNIFGVDSGDVAVRLRERLVLVGAASVRRVGVSGIRIRVEERAPAIEVRTPEGRFFADRDGRRIPGANAAHAIPVLRFEPETDPLGVQPEPDQTARAVVALLERLPKWVSRDVEFFAAAGPEAIRFRWREANVFFGAGERVKAKLRALKLVVRRVQESGNRLVRVDLRAPSRPASLIR